MQDFYKIIQFIFLNDDKFKALRTKEFDTNYSNLLRFYLLKKFKTNKLNVEVKYIQQEDIIILKDYV